MKDKSRTIKIIGLIVALMAGLGISSLLMRHSSSKENAAAAGKWFCLSENFPRTNFRGRGSLAGHVRDSEKPGTSQTFLLSLPRTHLADGDTFLPVFLRNMKIILFWDAPLFSRWTVPELP